MANVILVISEEDFVSFTDEEFHVVWDALGMIIRARGKRCLEQEFWRGKDFDELATAQGIHPIDDLSKLSKDWPEDTDFDTFFDAVRSSRD